MVKIIPTVFATSKKDFDSRLKKLLPISKNLQIDIMDGKFVNNKSFSISSIPNLNNYKNIFEAHLMTLHPEKYFSLLKKKGFKKIIFHYEAVKDGKKILLLIKKINSLKMECFIALNPENSIKKLIPFLSFADGVLLMGVHPGKEHQKLIPSTLKKIRELRKFDNKILIQIDGGVNLVTAKKLVRAGADELNSGSLIAESNHPKEIERLLQSS